MKIYKNEEGYKELIADVLEFGIEHPDHTDVGGCKKLFSRTLSFDLTESQPTHTLRLCSARLGFEEFWAFLNGVVDIHPYLEKKKVMFWEGNTTREALDKRNLEYLPEGYMGKGYSFQYRNFGGDYLMGDEIRRGDKNLPDNAFDLDMKGVDQIKDTYNNLRDNPFSRRHLVCIWNPLQLNEMTLPPCFWAHEFVCIKNEFGGIDLNLQVISRSADLVLGVPNNYQAFGLYLQAVATSLGYRAKELDIVIADGHCYLNQISYAEEILTRPVNKQKVLFSVNKDISSFEGLLDLKWEDIVLDGHFHNKEPMKTPRPAMAK